MMAKDKRKRSEIDIWTMILPLIVVTALCIWVLICPDTSIGSINRIREYIGTKFGAVYMLVGIGIFCVSIYLSGSKIGGVRLGNDQKPLYSNFQWGAMIFTSTMAADIVYYSCIEWAFYAQEERLAQFEDMQSWVMSYSLFHWGPIPWSFYLVLAVSFGFMIHIRDTKRQKISESLRPLFGAKVDGGFGRLVDMIVIFALLAGTATTFSLATPLLSEAICSFFAIESTVILTIGILLLVASIYTAAVLTGYEGISLVARISTVLFMVLLLWVFLAGGQALYIVENGLTAIGNTVQNFVPMATYMDTSNRLQTSGMGFTERWTIFYWAYWIVWCVATPFFIAVISKGRTIRNVILGGLV